MKNQIKKRSIKILCAIFLLCHNFKTFSQNDIELLKLKIDSTLSFDINKRSKEALYSHHRSLRQSKKISYFLGELKAYKSLVWYHGYYAKKEESLDSALYYSKIFESKILPVKDSSAYSYTIADHYINKGVIFNDIYEFTEEALNSFNKAYPYLKNGDVKTLASYDLSLANVYTNQKKYSKSLNILQNRLKDSLKLPTRLRASLMLHMSSVYSSIEKPELSIAINRRILKLLNPKDQPKYYWWTKNAIARNLFEMGILDSAKDSALFVRDKFKEIQYAMAVDNNSELLSQIYESKDINKSIYYLEEALKGNELFFTYSDFFAKKFNDLGELYKKKKDYKKAAESFKFSSVIYDSIRNRKRKFIVAYTDLSTKYYEEKDLKEAEIIKNELLQERNKKQKLYVLMFGAGFFILLLSFVLWYYYKRFKKGQVEVEKLKVNEKKLLEDQIKIRDNELQATVINLTKRISMLNEIKKQLDDVDSKEVKVIKANINSLINSTSELSSITDKISSKHPALTVLLKNNFPDLSNRDIDYCLLTKLNLSIKETASVLNVSTGTVKVARSKLKSKMGIPSSITLKDFLNSLE